MTYVFDVLIIFLLFFVFSFLHSLLASIKVKKYIKENFNSLIAYYRLGYNFFSLISLYVIYEFSPKPHLIIYDLKNPFDIIVLVPQLLSLIGIFWAGRYICVKEFLGINQIKRAVNQNYNSELDEDMTLTIGGPYRFMRHPLYFFSIIFLLFRPVMDLFYLTFFICVVIYFYVGAYFEEKKLVNYFGDVYVNYKKMVPGIIPYKLFKPYNQEIILE
jgi:methanethiol S-methyltransferase